MQSRRAVRPALLLSCVRTYPPRSCAAWLPSMDAEDTAMRRNGTQQAVHARRHRLQSCRCEPLPDDAGRPRLLPSEQQRIPKRRKRTLARIPGAANRRENSHLDGAGSVHLKAALLQARGGEVGWHRLASPPLSLSLSLLCRLDTALPLGLVAYSLTTASPATRLERAPGTSGLAAGDGQALLLFAAISVGRAMRRPAEVGFPQHLYRG